MVRKLVIASFLSAAAATPYIPVHLRGGRLWREYGQQPLGGAPALAKPQFLELPLDHANSSDPNTFKLKYWVADSAWSKKTDAPVFINMPSEGPAGGASVDNLTETFGGIRVSTEHRFFGTSVPCVDGVCGSATPVLRKYMSVEQNLADQAALLGHIQKTYGLAPGSPIVSTGGSYSGASAAWLRAAYPDLVSAAIAESGPIFADVDFYGYDAVLAEALSYRAGCREAAAATMAALDHMWTTGGTKGQNALKAAFNASHLIGTPQGDTDFLYFLGDSIANSVQYGGKALVCDHLTKLPALPTPQQYLANWQAYTLDALGPNPASSGCFYDSECMAQTNGSTSARSWYWMKCDHLAYLQTAPTKQPPMRPASVTVKRLIDQCKYIFGDDQDPTPGVNTFNAKHGGLHPEKLGQTKVAYFVFSDDPWKPLQPSAELGPTLPQIYTDCDGCAHCGAGVPREKLAVLTGTKIKLLKKWLGLTPV